MIEILENVDFTLFRLINQTMSAAWLDQFMILLSSKYLWIPLYLFIIFRIFRFNAVKKSVVMTLFLILAFAISDSFSSRIMKPVFKRKRPFLHQELTARLPDGPAGSKYGFVSSHSANFFAVLMLSGLFFGFNRKQLLAWLSMAAMVAYSRVYLGVHFPGDVFGGAVLGLLVAFGLWYIYRRIIAANG